MSTRRPIVLLRKRLETQISRDVAPDNPLLGVMLPYTPLHELLLDAVGDEPLVMTSGNRSDEPIAHDDAMPSSDFVESRICFSFTIDRFVFVAMTQ